MTKGRRTRELGPVPSMLHFARHEQSRAGRDVPHSWGAAVTQQEPGARTRLHLGQAAWTERPGHAEIQATNIHNMLLSMKMLSHSLLFYFYFLPPEIGINSPGPNSSSALKAVELLASYIHHLSGSTSRHFIRIFQAAQRSEWQFINTVQSL